MMTGLSVRSVLRVLIPAAAVAVLIGVVLTVYSRELDRRLGSGPEKPASSDLPSILHRVADSLSAADLAGTLAQQLVPPRSPNHADGLKRICFAVLLPLKYKKESLLCRLTTGEAILLFHIARFPDAPVPVNDPERTLELRNRLLLDLQNDKLITPAQYRSESSRPLILSGRHPAVW